MKISPYLKVLAEKDGSDLYLSTGALPSAKFNGQLTPLSKKPAPPGWVQALAMEIMNEDQQAEFEHKPEMNLAISESGIGRFRVNIFKQRNEVSMVIRNIKAEIPDLKELGLPPVLKDVIMSKRGIILFVGGTGSGKSTSLAALIDYRNQHSKGHIITIEDPIEYVHSHKGCIVNQREVGVDTDSFEDALKNTLRQAPDVILIGEIRDRETMEHAMAFAETGHLAISTLHANNANQALDRIINFFPEERHAQLLLDLSLNLRAFVSQRLISTVDKKRCAAIEILLNSPRVEELIKRGDVSEIKEVMEKSERIGMCTFDAALLELYRKGRISMEEALKNADSENNLRLKIELGEDAQVKEEPEEAQFGGLSLMEKEEPVEEEAENVMGVNLKPEADDLPELSDGAAEKTA
ncbi:MAG TPA: PilT/PilU family type 4a pilus ATPase [Gammaproteobacteria bacterium]|nr:PilT/PilU family type 4a pilus ATPase [Gammaproteobacteria bacterium]